MGLLLGLIATLALSGGVRVLLDHGADRGARDSASHRPADYLDARADDPAQSAKIVEVLR